MAVGAGDEPFSIGRPVLDAVGIRDGQLDGVAAIGVELPSFILPRRRGTRLLVRRFFNEFLLGRDQVLAVGRPHGAAALFGDLAWVVATSRIAIPDAVAEAAEDKGLTVRRNAAIIPVRDLLPFTGCGINGDDHERE